MVSKTPPKEDDHPTAELSPRLRKVVARILGDPPPEEVTRRCLDQVRRRRPATARRPRRRVAYVLALAVAACMGGVFLLWQFLRGGDPHVEIAKQPSPTHDVLPGEKPAPQPHSQPTWRTYYQAARQSPEALETLLDEHASQRALSGPTCWRLGVPSDS